MKDTTKRFLSVVEAIGIVLLAIIWLFGQDLLWLIPWANQLP